MAEEVADRGHHERVHDQLASGGTAGHERPGAAGEAPVVFVSPRVGGLDVGHRLGFEPVHGGRVGHVVDDGVPEAAQMAAHLGRISGGREMAEGHSKMVRGWWSEQ